MKTILVTGANRGLGRELVRQLQVRGERVLAASRQPIADQHDWIPLDLGDPVSIENAVSVIGEKTDRLDILINNAGIPHSGIWEESENFGTLRIEAMERVLRVNALGPLLLSQQLIPLLRNAAPSVLAGVTSYYSSLGDRPTFFANNFGYSMSKVSMNMWLRSVSMLERDAGVMTVALDPGWVRTDMGGPDAPLSPTEVVSGLLRVIDNLTPEQSGTYLSWDGKPVPW